MLCTFQQNAIEMIRFGYMYMEVWESMATENQFARIMTDSPEMPWGILWMCTEFYFERWSNFHRGSAFSDCYGELWTFGPRFTDNVFINTLSEFLWLMSGESWQFVPRSPACGDGYVPALERINHQESGLFDRTATTSKHARGGRRGRTDGHIGREIKI